MAEVTLKDVSGNDVTYEGVEKVALASADGNGTETFISERLILAQQQTDWNETDETSPAFIKNKPTIPSTEGLASETYVDEKIAEIDIPEPIEQVQSDWNETDETSPAFIKNKPVISADGSQSVQADYLQNDSTQADYIKNRPFYTDNASVQEVFPTSTIPFTLDNGVYMFYMTPPTEYLEIWNGNWDTATLTWDGVDYVCSARYWQGMKVIGNLALMMGTGDTGEPFLMAMAEAALAGVDMCVIQDMATAVSEDATEGTQITHDVALSLMIQEIHQIDPKYIGSVEWKKITGAPFGTTPAGSAFVDETVTMGAISSDSVMNVTPLTTMDESVVFDDVEYIVTINDTSYAGVGDTGMSGVSIRDTTTNEEIAFATTIYGGFLYITDAFTEGEEYSIKIVTATANIKQIDSQYLPDDIGGLPVSASSDSGKVLTVNSSGTAVWRTPATGLPTVTTSNNGKILKVVNGVWSTADETKELPDIADTDEGKILAIESGAVVYKEQVEGLPASTTSDNGKFLRVIDGVASWATVENAEEVAF